MALLQMRLLSGPLTCSGWDQAATPQPFTTAMEQLDYGLWVLLWML